MSEIATFAFNSGFDESADKKLLPPGTLRAAVNAVLRRDGQLEVRPGFTGLGQTTQSGSNMTAYDVVAYNERLVAFGDAISQGYPSDIFELVQSTPAVWRQMSAQFGSGPGARIPPATAVRDLGRLPDQALDESQVRTAFLSGFVATTHQQELLQVPAGSTNQGSCRVHVFNPTTGQTLLLKVVDIQLATVVAVGTSFWFIGTNGPGTTCVGFRFRPGTDTTLPGATTLFAAGATIQALAAAPITGNTSFIVAINRTTPVTSINRFTEAGSAGTAFAGPAANALALTIEANTTESNLLRMEFIADGGDALLSNYNAAGTLIAGETDILNSVLFPGASFFGHGSLCRLSTGGIIVVISTIAAGSAPYQTFAVFVATPSNHAVLVLCAQIFDTLMLTDVVDIGSGGYAFGCIDAADEDGAVGIGVNTLWIQLSIGLVPMPVVQKDQRIAGRGWAGRLNGLSYDGTSKLYWGNTVVSNVNQQTAQVSEVLLKSTARRQAAQMGEHLYFAGGLPLIYDGVLLYEQGFAEQPRFVSITPSNGSGALTPSSTYFVSLVWEFMDSQGCLHLSQPAKIEQVDMGVGEDTITIVASTPHSLRNLFGLSGQAGGVVRVVPYITVSNGEVLLRGIFTEVGVTTTSYGQTVTLTLVFSDAVRLAATPPAIYTDATPLAHHAPPPHEYMWPGRERIGIGGMPKSELWVQSKLLFANEPIEHAFLGELGFQGRVRSAITAVAMLDETMVPFTKREAYAVGGSGPGHNGAGEFFAGALISKRGGQDWRGLVETDEGLFYKRDTDKIYLLPRGGSPQWIGQAIRDTLVTYPVVTASAHITGLESVAFACQNVAGNDGVIVVYDLRRKAWFTYNVGVVKGLAEYDGRIAWVSSAGIVFLQDSAPGSGAAVVMTLDTGEMSADQISHLGYGSVHGVGVLCEYRGDASIEAFISYDGLRTYTTLGSISTLAVAVAPAVSYVAGDAVPLFWYPAIPTDRAWALRFVMTPITASVGLRMNQFALETETAPSLARRGQGEVH